MVKLSMSHGQTVLFGISFIFKHCFHLSLCCYNLWKCWVSLRDLNRLSWQAGLTRGVIWEDLEMLQVSYDLSPLPLSLLGLFGLFILWLQSRLENQTSIFQYFQTFHFWRELEFINATNIYSAPALEQIYL